MIDIESKIQKLAANKRFLIEKKEELLYNKDKMDQRVIDIDTAQVYLQKKAQETQSLLRIHIVDIVQLALDAVFPSEFKFDVQFEVKRGKTEAKLVFIVGDEEVNPYEEDGGGAVDIAAMALRCAVWALGGTRPTIILDEPFHNLSTSLQKQGAELLKELTKELGLQIIVITHIQEIADEADKVFRIKLKKDGKYRKSIVEEII